MKKLVFLIVIITVIFLFSCAKSEKQKPKYIAKVGDSTITEEDFKRELNMLPQNIQKIFEGEKGTYKFVDELVIKEILYQEAKKRGLDNIPEYQKEDEDHKKAAIIIALLEKEVEEKAKILGKDKKDIFNSYVENLKKSYTIDINKEAIASLSKKEEAEKQKTLEPKIEGHIETFMEMGGYSEEGIQAKMHTYLISGGIAYELTFAENCKFVGMEKQKGEDGLVIVSGGREILLHSRAKYRARGQITDTNLSYGVPKRPIKKLEVMYFELIKPGTGESGVIIGN